MPERLTKRINEHVYYTKGKYEETLPAECEPSDVRAILRRLAEYEDTGLEPYEIKPESEWKRLCKDAQRNTQNAIELLESQKKELAALRNFADRAERDYTECDKMFIHISALRRELSQ